MAVTGSAGCRVLSNSAASPMAFSLRQDVLSVAGASRLGLPARLQPSYKSYPLFRYHRRHRRVRLSFFKREMER